MFKTQIRRAASMDEYKDLLRQALDEVDDLRAAIEYDEDSMSSSAYLLEPLERGLNNVLNAIEEGSYQFAQGELEFMPLVQNTHDSLLPFKFLFTRINETHHKGLETDTIQ